MREFYGDWDASYNELQGWIAGMQEYMPRIVTDLQALSYKGLDGEIQSRNQGLPSLQANGAGGQDMVYGKYAQILLIIVAQDDN
ncbi:hypothetical protein J1N35_007289 [Gossypium stocksii]|uniref:Uncharacterized protein n=1 Tax=Gossypium stocksii TaxID=47602 RepID=A0A9D4AFG0_9ROSI|nr:hypothetical protein J1N35_007289 [Gossypium stocksii]